MAAAMIMNSNSLPVALLQSLVVTVPGLQWDEDDTLDTMVARALSYLLLCGTMGQFVSLSPPSVSSLNLQRSQLRWSYGVRLLSKAVPPDESTLSLLGEIGSISGCAGDRESLLRDGFFGVFDTTQDNSQITP